MAIHNTLGKRGEKIAKGFLIETGYEILDENWCFGRSEIDIIGYKDGVIIFAEVKTRSSASVGDPEEFVSEAKVKQLEYAATEYIELMDHHGEVRFDIISILFSSSNNYTLKHIDDAFWPD
ncbi:MAG: endonuclease [Pedobacter sp.]|nr:MAG: endonuclease [Pedobacter sp.]